MVIVVLLYVSDARGEVPLIHIHRPDTANYQLVSFAVTPVFS